MTKIEFLYLLEKKLYGLPPSTIKESLDFYSEIIDDRIEEGLSEEDAVSKIGLVDEIASNIIAETPISQIIKENITPKRKISVTEKVLLIVGSIVWVPLLIAAIAILISVYACLWTVILCLWAVFASFAGCFVGGIAGGAVSIVFTNPQSGLILIAGGLICASLAIFSFFGCKAATRGAVKLSKNIIIGIKNLFIKGGKSK